MTQNESQMESEGVSSWAARNQSGLWTGPEIEPWRNDAACLNAPPGMFFPQRGDEVVRAKAVCAECPVVDECLTYALDNVVQHGIWGGKSENERRPLRLKHVRTLRCRWCGTRFETVQTHRVYCGEECSQTARHETQAKSRERRAK